MSGRDEDPTSGRQGSLLGWLRSRLLPETADFYGLLIDQCAVTAEGTTRLVEFLRSDDAAVGLEVRRLEHAGDRVRTRNLETLQRSFATPMDREDIYDAVMAVDEILNYAKACVRELEILEISPDDEMVAMAGLVDEGAQALLLGFQQLRRAPGEADQQGERARKTERSVEKLYRRALARLFDPELQLQRLQVHSGAGASSAEIDQRSYETLVIVTQMLKRREIYRHLSNGADHVARAAQVLEDIVNKAT